jgi:hypothetical protein
MSLVVLSLVWALAALSVAVVLGRAIRHAEDGTPDGSWETFCTAHGLEEPARERPQVGA